MLLPYSTEMPFLRAAGVEPPEPATGLSDVHVLVVRSSDHASPREALPDHPPYMIISSPYNTAYKKPRPAGVEAPKVVISAHVSVRRSSVHTSDNTPDGQE
jgi:hypothetical protein